MSTPDISALTAQLTQLTLNHEELVKSLQQREQQIVALQNEVQQYRGALSYSVHVQDQTKNALEQLLAAHKAAELAGESASRNAPATT